MRNVTNIYDPSKKFSEYFWEMRAEIPKEKLEEFDKWLDEHNMVWAILFDGAENGYMLFADIEEELLLDGTVLTEDDFIGCIDNFFDMDEEQ